MARACQDHKKHSLQFTAAYAALGPALGAALGIVMLQAPLYAAEMESSISFGFSNQISPDLSSVACANCSGPAGVDMTQPEAAPAAPAEPAAPAAVEVAANNENSTGGEGGGERAAGSSEGGRDARDGAAAAAAGDSGGRAASEGGRDAREGAAVDAANAGRETSIGSGLMGLSDPSSSAETGKSGSEIGTMDGFSPPM